MELVKLNELETEKLNQIKSKEVEIVNVLNEIAIEEFKANYNLGEYARVADKNKFGISSKYQELKSKLENIIKPIIEGTTFKYSIMNFGTLSISHPITASILQDCTQDVLDYRHNVMLPYSYVMGKGIGKRYAKEWLEDIGYSM